MDARREAFENRLGILCRQMDNSLEDKFGKYYPLHPNRMERGSADNPSFDGLFATSFAFTLGYGSQYGRGYVVQIEPRTLETVNSTVKEEMTEHAFSFIQQHIPEIFPDRKLEVVHDGKLIKIIGDFSLS